MAGLRHHEDPPLFARALRFTATETGFPARLVEKDYFCSLVLEYLTEADDSLVFKGGTCLTKVGPTDQIEERQPMPANLGGFLIRFDEDQRATFLRDVRGVEAGFSDALSRDEWAVKQWDVCGLLFDAGFITHWALARKGRKVATVYCGT
jgi:hypothetical protein